MKSGKQTAQPDMDSSCTIVLDQQLGLIQKSKVYVENLNPQYEETLWFDIRQNELPAHMVVQVMILSSPSPSPSPSPSSPSFSFLLSSHPFTALPSPPRLLPAVLFSVFPFSPPLDST
jgi:hypothetical protein